MIFNFDPDRVSCCVERTNERCPGRADATGARTGGGDGDGDGGGEGITYWAEKAKKRMTALSVVARSSAEKDGRYASEDTRCEAYDVVKTSTFFYR